MKKTITITILAGLIMLLVVFYAEAQWPQWDTTGLEPMPTPRALCAATVHDGKIYVIGGKISRGGPPTAIVEVYDTRTNEWDTSFPSLNIPVCSGTAETVGDKIYIIGGKTVEGNPLKNVYVYDLANPEGWQPVKYLENTRYWHASTVYDGKIYVIGGINSWTAVDWVCRYDPSTNTWENMQDMDHPRALLSAEVVDGIIYAIGGLYMHFPQRDVQAYTIQNESCSLLTEMDFDRIAHSSAVIGDEIYVFGGWSTYSLANFAGVFSENTGIYDVSEDDWSILEGANMPDEEFVGFGTATVNVESEGQKCIYAIGGASPGYWENETDPSFVTGRVIKLCLEIVPTIEIEDNFSTTIYPDPFTNSTTIQYDLKTDSRVNLSIFNLSGEKITTLVDEYQMPGGQEIKWNSVGLPAGVYIYKLQTETGVQSGRFVLQR